MIHIVSLICGHGWHVQDLRRAASRLDVRLDAVGFPTLVGRVGTDPPRIEAGGIDLSRADAMLVRMMPPGTLEQVVFRMDALHRLEALGVPVVNAPRAVEAAVDKYLGLARIEAAGLSVPATWVGESAAEALDAFEALGGDVVIKPLFGSEGRGMVRASDPETAGRVLRALERIGAVLYVQRFVPNPGYDLRAFVLAGRVVAAIRRFPALSGWRANLAQGGRAEAIELDAEEERLAIDAAVAVGARVAGVDLLPTDAGRPVVLEVNAVPGWRGLAAATGFDIAAAILDDLRGLIRGGPRDRTRPKS
jgi:tetrahydromethanopterin:alpha-L-glutamate ligase